MNDAEIRRMQTFARVRDFLAIRAEFFSPSTLGGELSVEIGKIVDEMSKHAKTQVTSGAAAKEGAGNKPVLRDELYEQLMAIYRTARTIAIKKRNFDDNFGRPPRN